MTPRLSNVGHYTPHSKGRRGQVVLVVALALAVALVPLLFASLQLGYQADTDRTGATAPETRAEQVLERAVQNATSDVGESYEWLDRDKAVRELRQRLTPTLRALEHSRLRDGIAAEITYNHTRAAEWERVNCPRGPNRQFGSCETSQGVVIQERAGATTLLAVALDVRVTTPEGVRRVSSVYYVPGGSGATP